MKSLLITFDFPPIVSGIGNVFYNLWKFLPKEDNLILAPFVKGYKKVDSLNSFRIFRYPNFSHSRIIRLIILLPYVLFIIIKEKIDVIICGVPVSMGLTGLIFRKILKIPYIVFYYGGESAKYRDRKIITLLMKTVLKSSSSIITNSEFTSQEVKGFGVEDGKIYKILPGVDANRFRPDLDCLHLKETLGLSGRKLLLTVSRLVKRKGIDSVINALPSIIAESPNIIYLVVGSGREEDYLKRLVREKGLEDKVIFAGYVSDNELPKYYNACDIYVMPNRETRGGEIVEGFGISFIEASACAKPVIGGISGGAKEAVLDGKTGLLVEPENIEMLAGAIIKLLEDETLAIEFGRNGRERVEKKFQWKDRAQELKRFLKNSA